MKKSDLPWMLPLLTAWSQGKTLQCWDPSSNKWVDWIALSAPEGTLPGGAAAYRIKPELKTPGHVLTIGIGYNSNTYPGLTLSAQKIWDEAATKVIKAYKAGELELPEELK